MVKSEAHHLIHACQFNQTIGNDWSEQNKAAAVEGLADIWGEQNLLELLAWGNRIEDPWVRGAALLNSRARPASGYLSGG